MKNKILLLIVILLFGGVIFMPQKKELEENKEIKEEVKEDNKAIFVNLLNEETNTITKENLEEYVVGVVSAEMPSVFNMEALKAQAVAARTYALYKKQTRNLSYDLIIGTKDQAYKNNEIELYK